MPRPIEVHALPNFRVWLRYHDGVEGQIDLSDLVGLGVFRAWTIPPSSMRSDSARTARSNGDRTSIGVPTPRICD